VWGSLNPWLVPWEDAKIFYFPCMTNFVFMFVIRGTQLASGGVIEKLIKQKVVGFFLTYSPKMTWVDKEGGWFTFTFM